VRFPAPAIVALSSPNVVSDALHLNDQPPDVASRHVCAARDFKAPLQMPDGHYGAVAWSPGNPAGRCS
jgi:hypothetical protein